MSPWNKLSFFRVRPTDNLAFAPMSDFAPIVIVAQVSSTAGPIPTVAFTDASALISGLLKSLINSNPVLSNNTPTLFSTEHSKVIEPSALTVKFTITFTPTVGNILTGHLAISTVPSLPIPPEICAVPLNFNLSFKAI